jgi:hypothetical protein
MVIGSAAACGLGSHGDSPCKNVGLLITVVRIPKLLKKENSLDTD